MEFAATVPPEFPSILEADSLAPSSYQAAMFHLRQGLQAIYDLAPGGETPRRMEHGELIALLKQVIQLLHIQFAPSSSADSERRFGDILRQHRDEAGLTQEQLAEYSGLSLSLLRKLEQGTMFPSRNALLGLCSVPDLKLVPKEITSLPASKEQAHRLAPNWYVSPGFDSVAMLGELSKQLNGGSGAIEQTHAYLDHKSALDFISLCNTPRYLAWRDSFPIEESAARLRELVGNAGLDVIALGPGDGRTEAQLVRGLLAHVDKPNLRFYLLDASQPLLSRAFRHAMDSFGDQAGVFVCGIQGNFHHLPRYMQLHYTPARSHRRRIYTMLGCTLGNLDHEPLFFQHALAGAAPHDLLLFDVEQVFSDSLDPSVIQKVDPTIGSPVSEDIQRWLSGPILRYCHDAQAVTFSRQLDLNRPVRGSYGLQFMAKVQLLGGLAKEFCMFHVRRYQPESLVECLRGFGWKKVGLLPYRGSASRPRGVLLFEKQLPG